ncbi:High potential iron-sulfur protein [Massilia psychrophila]|uniref:High-potential iron-sulfur protein n=2 Tax=Massilia psychrophila TaxID=1603353 RepID=A0A2G8T543_9BURK|nr:High potential iron-sulfur protein [Massilia psychrophila]GGE66788.1 high-potential iron-sulfur protein [Massilia psychrophila]
MTTRRIFLTTIPAAALSLGLGKTAFARAEVLPESDPAAVALGYKADASKVDVKKWPTYAKDRLCANCQLYAGKSTDPMAPCGAFGGKQVSAKGWCAAWVKKA